MPVFRIPWSAFEEFDGRVPVFGGMGAVEGNAFHQALVASGMGDVAGGRRVPRGEWAAMKHRAYLRMSDGQLREVFPRLLRDCADREAMLDRLVEKGHLI